MVNKSTIAQISNTGEKYINAYNHEVKDFWQNHCGCSKPGLEAKCITCPFAIEFIKRIQSKIDPEGELRMIELPLTQASKPYSSEIKKRCVEIFEAGYSLTQIQKLYGIKYIVELKFWLERAGIYKSAEEYSQEQKQQCIDLYLEGKTPLEIEEITRISGFVISDWIHSLNLPPRSKRIRHSDEQQQLAISMYAEGKSYSKIKSATGISSSKVRKMAQKQNVHRQKQPKAGRPPVYSEQFKQTCLDLLAEGKTAMQIEQLMGVSAGSIRRWRKN